MAQLPRIFGPYPHPGGFRCLIGDGKTRTALPTVPTREAAQRIADAALRRLVAETPISIEEALERYREYLSLTCRENTITTAMYRLRSFLPDASKVLKALTPAKCSAQYLELVKRQKADTHRNALAAAKSFGAWLVEQKLVRENPFAAIKPLGTRSRGKEQLTNDEAKRWSDEALRQAESGNDGALAAYMTLLLNLRPGEVVVRTVRDVDDGGTRLRVRKAKTRAGDRDIKLPDVLQPLIAARCVGKRPDELLFPTVDGEGETVPHPVGWVRDNVRRLCRVTDVRLVCAHSLRGKHADLSVEAGMTPDVVAKSMGHTSSVVTMRHYAKPDTLREVQRARATERLGAAGSASHLRLVGSGG